MYVLDYVKKGSDKTFHLLCFYAWLSEPYSHLTLINIMYADVRADDNRHVSHPAGLV